MRRNTGAPISGGASADAAGRFPCREDYAAMSVTDTPISAPQKMWRRSELVVKDAAAVLGVTPETVRERIRAGKLTARRDTREGRRVLLVSMPEVAIDVPVPVTVAPAPLAPAAHADAPLAIAELVAAHANHLEDMRAVMRDMHAAHEEQMRRAAMQAEQVLEEVKAAHRQATDTYQLTLGRLTAQHDALEARLDAVLAANRRPWWKFW